MSQILQKVAPIGERRNNQLLKDAESLVYSSPDGTDLRAYVFKPDPAMFTGPRPAVAFFHGGFWDTPMVSQFVPHCHHFASRGAVAITFEYRTSGDPVTAHEDSVAAVEWMAENAEMLGINPERVSFGGAAGGAWIAMLLAIRKEKDLTLPFRPQALILFSSLVDTSPKGQMSDRFVNSKTAKSLSPMNQVRRKLPPMLFLHGTADRVAPFEDVVAFRRKTRWRGNKCTILDFTRADHSFFNFNVNHDTFEMTVNAADAFLVEHGLIDEQPAE